METKYKIHQRRKELQLTLEEVGKYVGVSKSTVRKWETGDIENMRQDKVVKLAEILKVSPAFIMGWDEKEEPPMPELSEEDSSKLEALLEIVDILTDDEWNRLMEYAVLLLSARKNSKDD